MTIMPFAAVMFTRVVVVSATVFFVMPVGVVVMCVAVGTMMLSVIAVVASLVVFAVVSVGVMVLSCVTVMSVRRFALVFLHALGRIGTTRHGDGKSQAREEYGNGSKYWF